MNLLDNVLFQACLVRYVLLLSLNFWLVLTVNNHSTPTRAPHDENNDSTWVNDNDAKMSIETKYKQWEKTLNQLTDNSDIDDNEHLAPGQDFDLTNDPHSVDFVDSGGSGHGHIQITDDSDYNSAGGPGHVQLNGEGSGASDLATEVADALDPAGVLSATTAETYTSLATTLFKHIVTKRPLAPPINVTSSQNVVATLTTKKTVIGADLLSTSKAWNTVVPASPSKSKMKTTDNDVTKSSRVAAGTTSAKPSSGSILTAMTMFLFVHVLFMFGFIR